MDGPISEQMGFAAGEAVSDLITQHWPAIELINEATHKKTPVSVTLKFSKVSLGTYKIVTSIRYAEKHSDEREAIIGGYPNQMRLDDKITSSGETYSKAKGDFGI